MAELEPGTVGAGLHWPNRDAAAVRDVGGRHPFDVAQEDHRAIVRWKLGECRLQHVAKLSLHSHVVDTRGPAGDEARVTSTLVNTGRTSSNDISTPFFARRRSF